MSQSRGNETSTGTGGAGVTLPAPGLAAALIRRAAARAPDGLAQRLEEEWLADLGVRRSTPSRLGFALGCCWASQVICRDYALSAVAVPAAEAGAWLDEAPPPFARVSRRATALGLVAGLHVAVFYAFWVGLNVQLHKTTDRPFVVSPAPEARPRELPKLPPPDLRRVPFEVPKLITTLPPTAESVDDDRLRGEPPQVVPSQPGDVSPPPPHLVKRVAGGPGSGFPNPDDFYPALARHLEEQGVAAVEVCVDPQGRLSADPTTLVGTGSPRLDEAALKLARAGSGHYRATTEDGKAVGACYPLRIRFQLRN